MDDKTKYLTRKQAADFLGVHPDTLAQWASTGRFKLPFSKKGGRAEYLLQDLIDFRNKGRERFDTSIPPSL